ncbi:hypothetical protein VTN49DRAFT_5938 [Thermomyces lanuginosus]|uniref:uncharacterized protein n=1 Tax=Thermomyces lanuginosus TaxID=5541 RepID=UPI003742A3F8
MAGASFCGENDNDTARGFRIKLEEGPVDQSADCRSTVGVQYRRQKGRLRESPLIFVLVLPQKDRWIFPDPSILQLPNCYKYTCVSST